MKLSIAQKRFLIAGGLGVFFGFVCAFLSSGDMGPGFWWGPMMWTIVTSRIVTGIFIGCVGVYKRHPVFGFKLNPILRGAMIGAITSIPLGAGAMVTPIEAMSPWNLFWASIAMGIIYGMIIDFAATKWGGEGKKILED